MCEATKTLVCDTLRSACVMCVCVCVCVCVWYFCVVHDGWSAQEHGYVNLTQFGGAIVVCVLCCGRHVEWRRVDLPCSCKPIHSPASEQRGESEHVLQSHSLPDPNKQ
jgi:hypothetical protein